jgi:hypothetical protein
VDRCDNSFSILKGLKKKKSARAERWKFCRVRAGVDTPKGWR